MYENVNLRRENKHSSAEKLSDSNEFFNVDLERGWRAIDS